MLRIAVRCINCSYNNVAKGIRLLDKKAFFVYTGKKIMQVELLEDISPSLGQCDITQHKNGYPS